MGINVLSLFDGISAGQLALQRAGIEVDNYYSSEIDKYAIKITQKNFPDTIQLGDINDWKNWNLPKIDLLIGGSPCQGFSVAGAGLNFDDPRSKLFFVFADILKYYDPEYFLLENVKMKKEWQDIISREINTKPIEINSALVSAQSRKRLYWTNIKNITQPEDKGIFLKDIIESGDVDREKSYCIDANYYKGGSLKNYLEKSRRQIVNLPSENMHQSEKRLMVKDLLDFKGFKTDNSHDRIIKNIKGIDEKANCLTSSNSGNPAGCGCTNIISTSDCIQVGEADLKGFDIIKRVYSPDGKSPSLTTMQGGHREPKISEDNITWRKLTPLECERLQTFPDGYTEGISNTQRYKSLGNSWTVDVISHIFGFLYNESNILFEEKK